MPKKKPKAYIYPITGRKGSIPNPYIQGVIGSLSPMYQFVNRDKPSNSGILDLLKYFIKVDILFLNWPEEIPGKKGGFIQSVVYRFLILYFRFTGKKIVWTLHNKQSHYNSNFWLKGRVINFTARKANLIITHASEGIELAKTLSGDNKKDILFTHHPMKSLKEPIRNIKKKYDILIWGTVAPYKGVDDFLEELNKRKVTNLRILIAGKIVRDWLREKILSLKTESIEIIDRFIDEEELEKFIYESKIVLFTYQTTSILSSGVLMDSLVYSPRIIGPDFGAFHDLSKEGIIKSYKNFDELFGIIPELLSDHSDIPLRIRDFYEENSWENFGINVEKRLSSR